MSVGTLEKSVVSYKLVRFTTHCTTVFYFVSRTFILLLVYSIELCLCAERERSGRFTFSQKVLVVPCALVNIQWFRLL